jgi:hypothetical protein
MPAKKSWSELIILAPAGSARKCCPGNNAVPGLIVTSVDVIVPQLLDLLIFHPLMSTVSPVGLKISINSSDAPFGPRVRNSLITT